MSLAATAPLSRPVAKRTQAERRETTQSKVILAAIACLGRLGYSLTSSNAVADEAGVTRGRMSHHFPTKVALMLAVVAYIFEEERERYREAYDAIPDPMEKILSTPSILWDVLSRPSGVAVLEIMLGARSDPALSEPFATLQAEIENQAAEGMRRLYANADVPTFAGERALHRLFVAAIRGLTIDYVRLGDEAAIRESVSLMRPMLQAFLRTENETPV